VIRSPRDPLDEEGVMARARGCAGCLAITMLVGVALANAAPPAPSTPAAVAVAAMSRLIAPT
jgi:hypothetical protein